MQLQLIRRKEKKMPLNLLFREFKENCSIKDAIIDYQIKENIFSNFIYCLRNNIDFEDEKERLLKLYYKHGPSYDLVYRQPNWELPEEKNLYQSNQVTFQFIVLIILKKKLIFFSGY